MPVANEGGSAIHEAQRVEQPSGLEQGIDREAAREGQLLARPAAPVSSGPTGLQRLGLDGRRDAWVYVPARYRPDRPAPLILSLHGAGGNGRSHLEHLQPLVDETGIILLAPDTRRQTWDVIYGEYGPDVLFIDRALGETFAHYSIDPRHLAVEGFSDGASYALSAGITNGDLFTHILAFSPGFMAPAAQRGSPRIFISHGTGDPTLRIDLCSRRITPQLEDAGYDVLFVEFEGGHTVPADIARTAAAWFMQPASAPPSG